MPFQLPPAPITITALRKSANADGSVAYEGNVVVEYRGSRILADRMVSYETEQRGTAEGNVVVIDPSGTLNADRLEIGWNPAHKYETAENAVIRIKNGILKARHADIEAPEWQLYDVEGTTALSRKPVYYVTSDRVRVTAQKQAIIHQPHLSVLGKFIAVLPDQRISLIKAVPSIGYPAPQYKNHRGFGATWAGGFLDGPQDVFNFNTTVYSQRRTSGLVQFTRSFLPLGKATQAIPPLSDFAERFQHGFLNNVRNATPESEETWYRASRSVLSFAGQLNGGVSDRDRGDHYSKIESVYEIGGPQGRFGYEAQARLQGIQPEFASMEPRLQLEGALSAPSVNLLPRVQLISRLDSEAFGGQTGYGWIQGTSGLTFLPVRFVRLSAGGYLSGDAGTPQFAMDPLYSRRGLLARSDLTYAGFTFSYLVKRDAELGAFDHEFNLRQVIGPFEVFYSKREYPHRRQIGILLRVQPFADAFHQRFSEVTGKPAPVKKR